MTNHPLDEGNGSANDDHWWIGDYNGEDCMNCKRERVMVCDHPDGSKVRVCEKCNWSPDLNRYVTEAIQ